ncbi:hypothetical protein B0189_07350 [Moraxella cuniculi]|nr:hypothetical protein B0189_07350 [Moraxella cuniculi]
MVRSVLGLLNFAIGNKLMIKISAWQHRLQENFAGSFGCLVIKITSCILLSCYTMPNCLHKFLIHNKTLLQV